MPLLVQLVHLGHHAQVLGEVQVAVRAYVLVEQPRVLDHLLELLEAHLLQLGVRLADRPRLHIVELLHDRELGLQTVVAALVPVVIFPPHLRLLEFTQRCSHALLQHHH